ncbi:hypothetical protein [Streptomyces sp. NPDC007264]|uniref:hypothetical protein n=1 Tax=Streptomyces sp. NPDC007264 TaxID=3364777 RepID=UPI0036D95453
MSRTPGVAGPSVDGGPVSTAVIAPGGRRGLRVVCGPRGLCRACGGTYDEGGAARFLREHAPPSVLWAILGSNQ